LSVGRESLRIALCVTVLAAVVAGCGGLTREQIAERRRSDSAVTGTNIPDRDPNSRLSIGNQEEFQRQMDKAVTRPPERTVPGG
jgi:hypothetical protein